MRVGRLMEVYLPQYKKLAVKLRRRKSNSSKAVITIIEDPLELPFSTSHNAELNGTAINYDHKSLWNIKEESMGDCNSFAKTKRLRTRVKKRVRCGRSPRELSDFDIKESLKRRRNIEFNTNYEDDKKTSFKIKKKVL
jgi:hypothetical protein